MKKVCLRLLSVLLAVTFIVSSSQMTIFAAVANTSSVAETDDSTSEDETQSKDYTYELVDDGNVKITSYTGSDLFVAIPKTIDGKNVVSIGKNAFADNDTVIEVTIPETVTSIESGAFSNCTSLDCILIPASVATIAEDAFLNSTEVEILCYYNTTAFNFAKDNSISYTRIYADTQVEAGSSCGTDAKWHLNLITGLLVVYGSGAMNNYSSNNAPWYSYLSKITSLKVLGEVTSIGNYAFYGYTSLKEIDLGSTIQSIGSYAFQNCTAIKGSLVIPNTVTAIGTCAFYGCSGFNGTLTLSENLTKIENYTFYGCSNVTGELVIPDKVTTVGERAFGNMLSVTSIVVGESVTILGTNSNSDYVPFIGMGSVTQVVFKGTTVPKSLYYSTYYNCNQFKSMAKLEKILVPAQAYSDYVTDYASHVGNAKIYMSESNEEDFVIEDGVLVLYQGDNANITIPDGVTAIGTSAFQNCKVLKSVILNDELTEIGAYAFSGCTYLSSITFNSGLEKIGASAFRGCTSLLEINFNSELKSIGDYAFSGCSYLDKVVFNANLETVGSYAFNACSRLYIVQFNESLTSIGNYAFQSCSTLEEVSFGSLLQTIGSYAFNGCTGLTGDLTIPSSVTSIGSYAFNGCTGIDGKLAIEGNETATTIGEYAFQGCSKISALELGDGVTSIGNYAFQNCSGMKGNLKIPNTVSYIGYSAFNNCYSFDGTLTLPEDITTIESYAFYNCYGITGELVIPDKVTTIGYQAFCNLNKVTSIVVGESVTVLGTDNDSNDTPFYNMSGVTEVTFKGTTVPKATYWNNYYNINQFVSMSKLEKVYVPVEAYSDYVSKYTTFLGNAKILTIGSDSDFTVSDGQLLLYNGEGGDVVLPSGVESIGQSAFQNCKTITSITFNEELKSVGAYAFSGCTSLESITFNDALESISDYAFSGCTSLIAIELNNSLKSIGNYAFNGCSNLSSITFNDELTSIGNYAFQNCTKLTMLDFNSKLATIGAYAFNGCTGLTGDLTIPESVTSIGNYAFYNCTGLNGKLTIEGNEAATTIGEYAFNGCKNITALELGDGITSIGNYAFQNLTSLTGDLVISDTVTTIGYAAFYGCTGLNGSLTLSENLTYIDSLAFYNCYGITGELVIPDKVTTIGYQAFCNLNKVTSIVVGESVTVLGTDNDSNDTPFYNMSGVTEVTFKGTTVPKATYWNNYYNINQFVSMSNLEKVYVPVEAYSDYVSKYTTFLGNAKILTIGSDSDFVVSDGELLLYNGEGGDVVLPTGVETIGQSAFQNCKTITSITFNKELKSVGAYAFSGCTSLTRITFNDALESISDYAFSGCTSLIAIELNNSLKSIGNYAFNGCSNLSSLTFNDELTSIGNYAYQNCTKLTMLDFNSKLATIGAYAFNGCTGLTGDLTIPESVTSIGNYAFYNCTGLNGKLTIEGNEAATTIGEYAFNGCKNITALELGDGITSIGNYAFQNLTLLTGDLVISDTVTTIGYAAFYGCTGLNGSLTLSENLTYIDSLAFYNCYGITGELVIPDKVTTVGYQAFCNLNKVTSIVVGENVTILGTDNDSNDTPFYNMSGVTEVTFKGTTVPKATYWNNYYNINQFVSMSKLEKVYVPAVAYANYVSYYKTFLGNARIIIADNEDEFVISDGTLLLYNGEGGDVVIPAEVEVIGPSAFQNCKTLTSVTFGENITSIGTYAFSGCTLLENVTFNDALATVGSYAFNGCASLNSVEFGENLTSIGSYAFNCCSGLSSVVFNKELKTIGSYAFQNCTKLTTLDFNNKLATIGAYAFNGCTGLTGDITIPSSVTSIGNYAFYNCTGLNGKLTIEGNEIATTIGENAFNGCKNITSLDLGAGITSIGNYAFQNLTLLTGDLVIPDTVTTIGYAAFYGCTGLNGSLTLSENLTYIDSLAFYNCYGITGELVIPDKVTTIGYQAFCNLNKVTSIVVGESVTVLGTDNDSNDTPFYNMSGVTEVTFKGTTVPKATYWNNYYNINQFVSMSKLEKVYVPVEAYSNYVSYYTTFVGTAKILMSDSNADDDFIISKRTLLLYQGDGGDVTIPAGVRTIGQSAFKNCTDVTSVTLNDEVTAINSYAFSGCTSLEEINFNSNFKIIGSSAFSGCTLLDNVTFSENITSLGSYAFNGCTSLSTVNMNDNLETIGSYAFNGCTGLIGDLVIPSGVITINEYAFNNCTGLNGKLVIEGSVKDTVIGQHAFNGCKNIKTLELGDGIVSIGNYAFQNLTSLTGDLVIPDTVTTIGYAAFYGCTGLNGSLTLSENLTFIDSLAFYNCNGITGELVIPDKVVEVRDQAFYNLNKVTSIVVGESVKNLSYDWDYYDTSFYCMSGVTEVTFKGTTVPYTYSGGRYINHFYSMKNLKAVYVPVEAHSAFVSKYGSFIDSSIISCDTLKSGVKNLTAIGRYKNSIKLSWTAHVNEAVEKYVVIRDDEVLATVTDCTYTDRGLETGSYTYSVYGVTADGVETSMSSCTVATAVPELVEIYTNHNANSIGATDGNVYIKAKNNMNFNDLDGNEIKGKLYYINADGSRTFIGTSNLSAASTTANNLIYSVNWDITDVNAGEYKVVFVIEDIDGAKAEVEGTVNVDKTVPSKIVNVIAVGDLTKINLSWSQSSEIDSTIYKIYRKSELDTRFYLVKTITNRTTLSYVDTNVKNDRLYYYYVVTENSFGTESEPSELAVGMKANDVEAPTVTKFTPGTNSFITGKQSITVTTVDNLIATKAILYYSIDNGETWNTVGEDIAEPFNFTFDTTKFEDGKIMMKAVAYDAAGNESLPMNCEYSIDNSGPDKVNNLTAKEILSSKLTLQWDNVNANDAACFILQQKTSDGYKTISKSITTLGYNLTNLIPGTEYTFRVAAIDIHGNIGEYSNELTVTTRVDSNNPVVTSLSPNPGRYSDSINFRAGAGDDCGIKSIEIQVSTDLKEWKTVSVAEYSTYQKTVSYVCNVSLADYMDGSIYVRAVAKDFSDNLSDISENCAYVEYIVDKTAPTIPRDLIASGGDGWIYISWLQNTETDASTYSIYRSTKQDSGYELIASNLKTVSYYDKTAKRDTVYYYKLRVTDIAGNVSEFSSAVSAQVADDITAPEIVSVNPVSGSYVGPAYKTVEALIKDNNCIDDIVIEYRINDEKNFRTLKEFNNIAYYYTTVRTDLPISELTDGDKIYIRVYATDIVGLISEYSCEYIYNVDKVAPTVTGLGVSIENDNAKITWSSVGSTDTSGYKVYRMNNDGTETYIGSRSYSSSNSYIFYDYLRNLGDGDYTYKLEAYDKVGNANTYFTDTIHYEYERVNTAPVAVIDGHSVMEIGVEEFFDAGKSTDDSQIVSYSWDFGDGTTSNDVKPVKKYNVVGTYTVTLTVTDDNNVSTTTSMEVSVSERTAVGTIKVKVVDENGRTVSQAPVYFDLGGDNQKVVYTDSTGTASLLMGKGNHAIGVYKSGYLPVQKEVTVLPNATRIVTMTIIEQEIVTGEFEVTRMTFSEIKAAGIDVYSPANRNVYKVNVILTYGEATVPVTYVRNDSKIISYSIGNSGGSAGSSGGGFGGSGGKIGGISYVPNDKGKEIIAIIEIPIEASILKEFFDVKLHIVNNASPEFVLVNNTVTLDVPEGMTMMTGLTGDWSESKTVEIKSIKGQETKTLSWILRGDKEGSYNLSADFNGTLDVFNEEINATFKTEEPIRVYGLSNFKINLEVSETIEYNALYFNIGLENKGTVDIHMPQIDFDPIVNNITASAYYNNKGMNDDGTPMEDFSRPSSFLNMRYEFADGTNKIIPIQTIETLAPGEIIWYEYAVYNITDFDEILEFKSAAVQYLTEYGGGVSVGVINKGLYNTANLANKLTDVSQLDQDAVDYITDDSNYLYWNKATSSQDLSTKFGRFFYNVGDTIFNLSLDTWTDEDKKEFAEAIILQLLTSQDVMDNIDGAIDTEYIEAVKSFLETTANELAPIDVNFDDFYDEYAVQMFRDKYGDSFEYDEESIVPYDSLKPEYQKYITDIYENREKDYEQLKENISGIKDSRETLYALAEVLKEDGEQSFVEALATEVAIDATAGGLVYLRNNLPEDSILGTLSEQCEEVTGIFEKIETIVGVYNNIKTTESVYNAIQLNACIEEEKKILEMIVNYIDDASIDSDFKYIVKEVALEYQEIVNGKAFNVVEELVNELGGLYEDSLKGEAEEALENAVSTVLRKIGGKALIVYEILGIGFNFLDDYFKWGERFESYDKLGIYECLSSVFLRAWLVNKGELDSDPNNFELALDASRALKYLTQTRLMGEAEFKSYIEEIETEFVDAYNKEFNTTHKDSEELFDEVYGELLYARDRLFSVETAYTAEPPAAPTVSINYDTFTTNEVFDDTYEYCYSDGEWKQCEGKKIPVRVKTHATILRVRKMSMNGCPAGYITTVNVKAQREFSKVVSVKYDEGVYYFKNTLDIYIYEICPVDSAYSDADWSNAITFKGGTNAKVSGKFGNYIAIRTLGNEEYKETVSKSRIIPVDTKKQLVVNVCGNGTVTQSSSTGKYFTGDTVNLTAVSDAGAAFRGWFIDGELVSRDSEYIVEMYPYADITAKFEGGNEIKAEKLDLTLLTEQNDYVQPALNSMFVDAVNLIKNSTTTYVYAGTIAKVVANIYPVKAVDKSIVWTTSNENVAKVDNSGMVEFVSSGTVIITATLSNGVTDSINVTVLENNIEEFYIKNEANKTTYYENEKLDLTGLLVLARYSDGRVEAVTDYEVTGYNNTCGTKNIKLSYEGKTVGFTVDVIHKLNWNVTKEPTCSADGLKEGYCSVCKETVETKSVEKLAHTYEWVVEKEATQVEDGIKHYECTVCGDVSDEKAYEWCDHEFTSVVTKPTCEAQGYTTKICTKCDETVIDSYTDALGHLYSTQTVEASCGKKGYTIYDCDRCGHKRAGDIVKALKHSYTETKVDATCTEHGYVLHACENCDDSYKTDITEIISHSYETTVTKPGCDTNGYTTYSCKYCDYEYISDEVEALGHDYTETTVKGNCTEGSYVLHECTKCDHSYKSDESEKKEHKFGEWLVRTSADEGHAGVKYRTCVECGHEETGSIPVTDHPHVLGDWYVEKEASCSEYGIKAQKCEECLEIINTEEIPMLEHKNNTTTVAKTCTEDGYTLNVCTVCGNSSKTNVVIATGHKTGDWIVEKNTTCTEDGRRYKLCSECKCTVDEEVIEATGHKNCEWIVTKDNNCTETGEKIHKCNDCKEIIGTEVIAPTGHKYQTKVTAPSCTEKGYTTYTCVNCSDTYTDDVTSALTHNYEERVVEPTETEKGYTLHTCTRCNDSYKDNYVDEIITIRNVSICGDINLALKADANKKVYSGDIKLNAGTYEFKVNVDGQNYGSGSSFTNAMSNVPYSLDWKSSTVFTTDGGKYSFRFDAVTNKLSVFRFNKYASVETIGGLELTLKESAEANVFTTVTNLRAGTYKFKVAVNGVEYGCGTTFNGTMYNVPYSADWKIETTFTTDGGQYMFKYNAETKRFYAFCIKKYASVKVIGDFGIELRESADNANVFVATANLEKGSHRFKITVNGKEYGCGSSFNNSMYEILYNSDWKGATTFNSVKGKYMFRFNAETKKLSVFLLEKYNAVELIGDIELDLAKSTVSKNTYTATKKLEAGTYTFKISVDDVEYGFGSTFSESIYKMEYSPKWSGLTTFNVKGGNYRFTFDLTTNKLTVYSVN